MNCEDIRALFSDMYDKEADGEQTEIFETHLRECTVCSDEFESYRAFFDEIKALPQPEPPAGFHESMMALVKRETGRKKPFPSNALFAKWAWGGAGAAACFILISILVSGLSGLSEIGRGNANDTVIEAGFAMQADTGAGEAIFFDENLEVVSGGAYEAIFFDEKINALSGAAAEADSYDAPLTAERVAGAGAPMESASYARSPAREENGAAMLAAGYYQQTFTITLWVDNLEEVNREINRLSGYSLYTDSYYSEYGGSGTYHRRVDLNAYARAQNILRSLGKVTQESENVTKLADQIQDLEARLTAKINECERLKELLSKSYTMNVLTAVERRLGDAESERDMYRGELNMLYNMAAYPYLYINVYENPPEPAMLTEAGFLEKLENRFIRSLNGFIEFMENTVIFLSGAILQLLLLAGCAGSVFIFIRRHIRKKRNGREAGL